MPSLDIPKTRDLLQDFDFQSLFVEVLNWSRPATLRTSSYSHEGRSYEYRHIAELSGVVVLEVVGNEEGIPPAKTRKAIYTGLSGLYRENLLIFVDKERSQSLWYWVKREEGKSFPREHIYIKGQPGDLFIHKLSGMVLDISQFDEFGNVPLVRVSQLLQHALDIERTIKKFFTDYAAERLNFTELIAGIEDERQRRWYASVLLHRLMFIYFLQSKFLLDNGNNNYLQQKLDDTIGRLGAERYYDGFLKLLFFEGFAKPEQERSAEARQYLGSIAYLNGGLFLQHQIEKANPDIRIPDKAFENLFALFRRYSWNLNDTPGGKDDEINPDVLGYIFEKYINQKAFGAYYTRPEITEYLCEHTIHQLVLDKMNPAEDIPGLPPAKRYAALSELLLDLDAHNCRRLLFEVLPKLSLLDPACGSGAFLVAAMKTLINIYSAVTGRIEYLSDRGLKQWLAEVRQDHRSLSYHIKRKIITENLYGVDVMEEACDIARLRLFLALVSSVSKVEELEPLPNIDFNILAGNSLIGLQRVPENEFDGRLQFNKSYRELVAEKNRKITRFREFAEQREYKENLQDLRDDIQKGMHETETTLDDILLDEFQRLKIQFEQATWDEAKRTEGKPKKRPLTIEDIRALQPFHWGYAFDEILNTRGGFDAIIANPPWEIFKPNAKEFFAEYSDVVTKNKMTIKEFEEKQGELLQDSETRAAWLEYLSRFPYLSLYYRCAKQYENQISVVNGKKAGTDINLYKLFAEQCFHLLRRGGQCGIVLPSGIYTDLGTKQLRQMLFQRTRITGLFGFENRKEIFEGVHRSFKFVALTFAKGGVTERFPTAFMRHEVSELKDFPERGALSMSVELIKRLSPDSLSVMEFKSERDVLIAEKMLKFPLLGEKLEGTWNLALTAEFHMTNDSKLFRTAPAPGRLPLYEGKMIHQFTHTWGEAKYWVEEAEGRQSVLKRGVKDTGQTLDYQGYRLAHRSIASNTNERTMIVSILPCNVFFGHSLNASNSVQNGFDLLYITTVLNSFVFDYALRQRVTSNLTMFFVYQMPVPRLTAKDPQFTSIVERAARLICTAPEYDDLAREVGLGSHRNGVADSYRRSVLRAELDGLIAHLYGLTELEFAHILSTFPLVAEPVRVAAQNAYRDVERGLIK